MRKTILIFSAAVAIAAVSCTQGGQKQTTEQTDSGNAAIGQVNINPDESRVVWKGEMLGIYSHEGTVNLVQADIDIKEGMINGGTFVIDLNSIIPTDENYNPEEGSTPEKLVGHLQSPDFFDTENHPTAMFEITGVEGNMVKGNLTIRGITNEETIENVSMMKEGDKVKITGDMVFERKAFNVSWDHPLKERVLDNNIMVKIELVGTEA